jgi:RNA polymerase sigma-70 factor (ECF subfamily)
VQDGQHGRRSLPRRPRSRDGRRRWELDAVDRARRSHRGGRAGGGRTPDRVLHSDPHDFAGLYIRHRSSFTLHARRYLRDGRDADEVVQEAFLRLFLALPELETELQALAYCRRTITNLCIDRYRAQARRPSLVDLDSVAPEDLADDDPGDPVVRAEDAAIVREAMSMLSPLHRAALVKREIEEKPLPVIAEELDIPRRASSTCSSAPVERCAGCWPARPWRPAATASWPAVSRAPRR